MIKGALQSKKTKDTTLHLYEGLSNIPTAEQEIF